MTAVPPAGAHGGDGAAVAAALGIPVDQLLDLSMSLNPLAPDVRSVVARHLDELTRYPDATRATAALAEVMGLPVEHLLLTNGGSEAITLAARTLGGGVAAEPEFALHPRAAGGPRWRSNPHNPTGLLASADEVAEVWDEAFWPLATGTWTRGDIGGGSVVVGSLTKLFACPGLRLGYLASADGAVLRAAKVEQPGWAVGGLALAALPDLLAVADLPGWAAGVAELRRELVAVLAKHDLDARPSDANWVLADGADGLRASLAGHGVLVRDCASFGMPGTVRIAVPGADGLARLEEALCRVR